MTRYLIRCAAFILLGLAVSQSWGQTYPERPIRLVVGYPAGGASDLIARVLGQELSTILRQPVVVDNRAGAGGTIAAADVAKAPKDGYSLFLGDTGSLILSKAIYKKLPMDPDTDIAPISLIAEHTFVLAVNSTAQATTIQEFIDHAKARPGTLSYGSPGNGSPHHIAMEQFKSKAGVDILHIPYRGAAPATTDFIAGQIPVMLMDPASALANIKSGKIRGLVVLADRRLAQLPDVPTVAEAGIAGSEASNIWALMAPQGTPAAVITTLAAAVKTAVELASVKQRLSEMGISPISSSPEKTGELLQQQRGVQRAYVRKLNVQLD